jgi:hypothetical protein
MEITMAFGFPAYHTEELPGIADSSFQERIIESIRALGWKEGDRSDGTMTATTKTNIWSWGEHILIRFHKHGATITSRCSSSIQCFDWGKNKSNVRKLLDEFGKRNSEVGIRNLE